jgi:Undecaprenyl-phosphate glucose phosphotransferase
MSTVPNYILTSRSDTGRLARLWTALVGNMLPAAILIGDIAIIVAMSCFTGIGYHLAVYHEVGEVLTFLNVGALAATIFVVPNVLLKEYRLSTFLSLSPHFRLAWLHWNVSCLCLLVLAFLAKVSVVYSRGWFVLFYLSTLAILFLLRYLVVQLVLHASRSGLLSAQRAFLVGTGQQIGAFVQRYETWKIGVNVVGCRFLTPLPADVSTETRGQTLDRDLAEAVESARYLEPDAIYLLLPWSDTPLITRCAEMFLALPVEIHLGPEQILHRFGTTQLSKRGPMSSLQLTRLPLSWFEVLQKRLFDLLSAGVALALLTPFLLIVMALIKLDSAGPVFFLQRRYGFNQREFRIVKFRTMTTLDDGAEIRQAVRDDPRITRIGRWLRRWNIDEIPQLFNVLAGDMSLVGPRPHALTHNHDYEHKISLYARRHNVKPGITGWAQIHGFRGETNTDDKMRQRVEHDLYYIDNWSIWLDLRILIQTVLSPTAYRNAY